MSRKSLSQILLSTLIFFFLTGCAASPTTPVADASPAADTAAPTVAEDMATPVAATVNERTCTGTSPTFKILEEAEGTPDFGRTRYNGIVSQMDLSATCPELSGQWTQFTIWSVDNPDLEGGGGPTWGTFRLETDYGSGGAWEGTWHGEWDDDPSPWTEFVSHIALGSVEGMEVHGTIRLASDSPRSNMEATIVDTPGG